jgi:hypothetical protein
MENIARQKLTILARLEKNLQNFYTISKLLSALEDSHVQAQNVTVAALNFVPSKEDTGLKC